MISISSKKVFVYFKKVQIKLEVVDGCRLIMAAYHDIFDINKLTIIY